MGTKKTKAGARKRDLVNRELSWLEFNQRVLDEATAVGIPLLERLKFLAITASNLDEFFMVRVGGLQLLRKRGSRKRDPAGMTAFQQLREIGKRVRRMIDDQYVCLLNELEPGLREAGVCRLCGDSLNESQHEMLDRHFRDEIFPIYTPQAIHAHEDFPLVINRTLNLLVRLAPGADQDEPRFAIIPFGHEPHRFIRLPAEKGYQYILLEDVMHLFIDRFFTDEEVLECVPFRITRNADMSVREDMAADLMSGMEEVLDQRKESDCVRLEIADTASREALTFLEGMLEVQSGDIYQSKGPLDLSAFMRMSGISGFDELKYEAWPPLRSPGLDATQSMFDLMRQEDHMLSLPYESFEPVVRLIEEAADDDQVLAIKIILYRTSRNSPIVAALRKASERGKHVTAIVELKARFDEARNIEWAKSLEQTGVQVIYGVKGLKTHAKVCIVVRRETHGIRRYLHFSTGNYNEATAKLYSDICLLTCNEELANDATSFFNAITGYSQPRPYQKLAAAPFTLRNKLLELIEGEVVRCGQGERAHIMAQLNSLADPILIRALYAASQAGVKVELNIRGICCLRPGVKGLSENIRVVSILDRYLEHSRIIYFYHGGDRLVFISSADWMPRNLDRRVETLVPVESLELRKRLIAMLKSYAKDNVKGRLLLADGGYRRLQASQGIRKHAHQDQLYTLAKKAEEQIAQSQRTVFEPHRAGGKDV